MMWPCPKCGLKVKIKPERFPVNCRCGIRQLTCDSEPIWPPEQNQSPENCIYGGEQIRLQKCESCNGTKLKVFACSEFAECTIGKEIPGIACCLGCEKFEAEE